MPSAKSFELAEMNSERRVEHLAATYQRADRYYGYGDAIYASLRLVEILSNTKRTLSELLADVPKTYATPELRVDCCAALGVCGGSRSTLAEAGCLGAAAVTSRRGRRYSRRANATHVALCGAASLRSASRG